MPAHPQSLPLRALPPHANLEQLRHQAKDLLKGRDLSVLRLLDRFENASDAQVAAALESLPLHEAQYALALAYGFPNWAALKTHLEAASTGPTYRQVIDHYLRPDVSEVLWQLSRRRPLKFFFRSAVDLRQSRQTPEHIGLHCLPSREAFVREIQRAAAVANEPEQPGFFPFLSMANVVNAPGEPDRPIGYDMRFEVDLDLAGSFRALIPALAVLEHLGLPVLAKYSGHRSLHLVVPAEAFPAAMKRDPDHAAWMTAVEQIGRLLCRLSPGISTISTRLAKDTTLTTPYSLHRYHGRVSLPLDLAGALAFDPETARLDRFAGVTWRPEHLDAPGNDAMAALLALAAQDEPEMALRLAREVFVGPRWASFAVAGVPADLRGDPIRAAIFAGLPAIGQLSEGLTPQLARAIQAVDAPDAKEMKLKRMVSEEKCGPGPDCPEAVRRFVVDTLAAWVRGGMAAVLDRLDAAAGDAMLDQPVSLAVRLAALVPAAPDERLALLLTRWHAGTGITPPRLFHALALGELAPHQPSALDALTGESDVSERQRLADLVRRAPWKAEERPDLAVATLALAFGASTVRGWADGTPDADRLLMTMFGHLDIHKARNRKKFTFALRQVFPEGAPSS